MGGEEVSPASGHWVDAAWGQRSSGHRGDQHAVPVAGRKEGKSKNTATLL